MSVAPLLVGYTQALSSIQSMSSQNVQNPSTSNHKELWGCCIGTQTAFAVERFVCQRRDCNGGSGSECIAISFCDAVAPYRLRFSAKIAIDFNSSPAFHGRATLLRVVDSTFYFFLRHVDKSKVLGNLESPLERLERQRNARTIELKAEPEAA
jgi:hypothetical protein